MHWTYLGLEPLLGVGGISYRPDETIGVDHRIASGDFVALPLFLAVLVVSVVIVLHVKSELIRRIGLEIS